MPVKVHRINDLTSGEDVSHAMSGTGYDSTLCGLALEGEENEHLSAIDEEGLIDCQQCKQIIHYCKTIKTRDMR